MDSLKRMFCGVLALLMLNVVFSDAAFARKTKKLKKITKSSPSIITSVQEPIPVEVVESDQGWLGRNKWWVLLGIVAAGGAAAAAGGGGGGNGDDDTSDTGDTGKVTVYWE